LEGARGVGTDAFTIVSKKIWMPPSKQDLLRGSLVHLEHKEESNRADEKT